MSRIVPGSVTEFFGWWRGELASLPFFAFQAPQASDAVVVDTDGSNGLVLTSTSSPASVAGADNAFVPLEDLFAKLARTKPLTTIVARLPLRVCFTRIVELPNAASRDFDRILSIDLERATPLKAKDVYARFVPIPSSGSGQAQAVRQFVVKRAIVERIRVAAEANGLKLVRVECWNQTGTGVLPANFLDEARAPTASHHALAVRALAASVVVLAVCAVWLLVQREETALLELQQQTAALKLKAQAVRDKTAKAQAASAFVASFNSLRKETVSRAAILEEITHVMPDSAWLSDLKVNGSVVDISGLAPSASSLIPEIERSPYFIDAASTSPVTFDPHEDKERFGIRMHLRGVEQAAVVPPEEEVAQ